MSAAILAIPGKKHQVSDDLEAFIHVLRWMCLRFYDAGIPSSELRDYVSAIFDNYTIVDGEEVGGHIKLIQIAQGVSGVSLGGDNVMETLLDRLALLCQQHYHAEYLSLIEPQQHSGSTPRPSGLAPAEFGAESEAESEEEEETADEPPLQASTSTALPPNRLPSAPTPQAVLSSHDYIIAAFTSALQDKRSWERVVKGGDRFAAFKDPPVYQIWLESSSIQSSVKRSRDQASEGSQDKARPTKLARTQTGTGTPLESVEEEVGR